MEHGSHAQIGQQLKQAHGQLASILAMMADGRPCADLAQQLQAVESIVRTAKRALVQDHMEHCIGDAVTQGGMSVAQAMREVKALAKYL